MLQTTKSQFKKPQPHMQFFWNRNEHCKQLPAYYVILAMLAALVGYCFILGFPILFVVSIYDTAALLPFYPVFGNLTETLGWITLSIFLGHVSYNILTADFTNIPGLKIKRNSDGRLMQLLDDIQVEYTQPKIRQIIITQEFELKLIKIPHFGLPILADNILVIGLPLLLTLSPKQFKCLLTREIIQYSTRRNLIVNWLNHLGESWSRYRIVLQQRSCIGHQVLYGIFVVYSPLYDAFTLQARITDELTADRNALDLINSDELLSAFQAKLIAKIYVEKYFWPDYVNGNGVSGPFSTLNRVAKAALSQSNSEKWLQNHKLLVEGSLDHYPTLQQRMDNLGSLSVKLPPDLTQTAAEYYFQNQAVKIINMSDNNWQDKRRTLHKSGHLSLPPAKRLFDDALKKTANSHEEHTA